MRLRFPVPFLLLALAGVASAQSLGELAEKEKARRKAAAAAGGQTFTNDDLEKGKPATGASPSPTGKATPSAKPAASASSSSADSAGAEASWRQQAQSARDAITAAEQAVAQAEKALGSARTGISQPLPSDGLRQLPPNGLIKEPGQESGERDLAAARAGLERAKAAFADLEERARKASIPPGWLR